MPHFPDPEEFRPVAGFPGYSVSSYGRVVSHRRGTARVLTPTVHDTGYLRLALVRDDGTVARRYVHRLVAEAFHGPFRPGQETRHLNGDRLDNRAANVVPGSRSENQRDNVAHGTHYEASRTHCPAGHPYDEDNTYVTPARPTARYCRACTRARQVAGVTA
jgi:hypothetical protein